MSCSPRASRSLSLFFIDEVAKYRDYDREDTLGDYARVFEEEYAAIVGRSSASWNSTTPPAATRSTSPRSRCETTHEGYFSIDKKTKRQVDGDGQEDRRDEAGQSDDVDAYDLILKDKERLLSFAEPVRFIFSHSALREGWDNPNVFVMGMLKKSDNTVSRRQEIGRGLRLAVDQHGERMDNPVTVHDINELTVVTDESYTDFVAGLQKEIAESLAARPRKASVKYFTGKTDQDRRRLESVVEKTLAQALYKYLIKNDYINDDGPVSEEYKDARDDGTLAEPTSDVLKPVIDFVWPLVDSLYIDLPAPTDDRKPKKIPLNEANFAKKGVPGSVGPDQPQGRLPGRVRLRRADRQVRPCARQAPQRRRDAIRRPERQAGRRPRSRRPDGRRGVQGVRDDDRHRDGVGRLPGQVRPAR